MKAPALSTASTQHNPLSHFHELINIQLCLLVWIFISKVEVFTNFGHLLSQVNKSLILQRDICRKQKTAELTLLIPTCNLLCKEISRNTHTQCTHFTRDIVYVDRYSQNVRKGQQYQLGTWCRTFQISRYLEYCYCFGLNRFDLSMEMFSDSKHNISTDVINENSKAARQILNANEKHE